MYNFEEAVRKIDICCRSLLAGCFGTLEADLRIDLEAIAEANVEFNTLVQSALNTAPGQRPDKLVHDLYNPLNVVMGYSEILVDTRRLNAIQRLYVQIIGQQGQELVAAVDMTFRENNIRGMA
ncbi:MAG: hypothetical protein OHK0046_15360 [Anaerolineae bacterium]